MTRARSSLVSLETTPYYHCTSRCVRRAFLCGRDTDGRSYDHRKQWIVDRIRTLADVFAINIAAYAVMSNHYHLVLHVDISRAASWTDDEVMHRWSRLYRGPKLLQRVLMGEALEREDQVKLNTLIQMWREELCNISRFMACMNYVIAVRANKEDGCTGRFWEGRFKSQALRDEAALLGSMAYVDLNPVRAGIAQDLPSSEFTSIQARILQARKMGPLGKRVPQLMPFAEGDIARTSASSVPCRYRDYLELVDWYGRQRHRLKGGRIADDKPRLLTALGLSNAQWDLLSCEIGRETNIMLHGVDKIDQIERQALKRKAG